LAITRRRLLQGGTVAAMAPALGLAPIDLVHAQPAPDGLVWRHALSTFGDVKYPAGFKGFDYVKPDAPKGGVARLFELGTFDNFNMVIQGLKGSIAGGATLINQTLTTR
jgi:microcin C transport system substrate-binding protein